MDESLTFKLEILKMTLVFKSGLLLLVSGEGGGNRWLEMQLSEGYPWLQNLG